jgi:hypothetical protein
LHRKAASLEEPHVVAAAATEIGAALGARPGILEIDLWKLDKGSGRRLTSAVQAAEQPDNKYDRNWNAEQP